MYVNVIFKANKNEKTANNIFIEQQFHLPTI